jgi:hypothetical protein
VTSHLSTSVYAVTSAFTAIHPVLNRNQRRYHVKTTIRHMTRLSTWMHGMSPNSYCVRRQSDGGNGDALCMSNTFCPQIVPFKRQLHQNTAAPDRPQLALKQRPHRTLRNGGRKCQLRSPNYCFLLWWGEKLQGYDDGPRLYRGRQQCHYLALTASYVTTR